MKKLEPYVDSAILFLLKKLANMQGQEIDVGRWTRLFAYGQ